MTKKEHADLKVRVSECLEYMRDIRKTLEKHKMNLWRMNEAIEKMERQEDLLDSPTWQSKWVKD